MLIQMVHIQFLIYCLHLIPWMNKKILTRHPQKKKGIRIDQQKYDVIRGAILKSINDKPLSFSNITKELKNQLQTSFDGSINWYTVVVKLDLESRGEICRIMGRPDKYSISS